MVVLVALLCGLLLGTGLIVAGMADPTKVLGFLDIAGNWDPSLACVMGGAIAIMLPAVALAKKRRTSMLGEAMQWPTASTIDRRLVAGSALFGIGWGITGICPGPSLVLLSISPFEGMVFLSAMVAGMLLFELLNKFAAFESDAAS